MAIHSSTIAWKIPWTKEPGRLYSPWGRKESDMTELLNKNHNIICEFAWYFPNGKTYSPRVDLHVFVYVFSLAWIVGT